MSSAADAVVSGETERIVVDNPANRALVLRFRSVIFNHCGDVKAAVELELRRSTCRAEPATLLAAACMMYDNSDVTAETGAAARPR